ncbi:AAA family ATPase [Paracoccus sp. (in: a-proteobacteria)]|uniref:AAA family ATPase n=1 Tax=Paracoccus sp. TaxID=267 RepID=UPI003A8A1ED9
MELDDVLERISLTDYRRLFQSHDIDLTLAQKLSDGDLREIGIASLGHRRKLLAAFAAVKDDPPAIARRSVVVLFADLVDSTLITRGLDPEQAFDLISSFFAILDDETAREGGTVERHLGDALMAVFGAPNARGDEALRAARLGLGLHHKLARLGQSRGLDLKLRIGIAAGEAVVRNASAGGLSVVGASVNLAARLASSAEPGETLVTDQIRAACGAAVRIGDSSSHRFKGFEGKIRCWQVLGLADEGSWVPVGRSDERQRFDTVLSDLDQNRTGQLIILRGEAGIGKTSLLSLWLGAARGKGFQTHVIRVLDFGGAQGAAVIADITDALSPLANLPEMTQAWLDAMAGKAMPSDKAAMIEAAAPEMRTARQFEALEALFRSAAAASALLIAVEDTHWADQTTLSLLSRLCRLAGEIPLIVVATTRLEGDQLGPDWRAGLDRTPIWTVELGPLTPTECQLLARAIISAGDLTQRAITVSGGHPLYLEQLLRHGIEDFSSGVPPSIQTLIQARVDMLDRDNRRAVQAAAVLGQKFTRQALRALLGWRGYDPSPLVERRILHRDGDGDGLAFHHALIRDCVYASLLTAERIAFHRAAADWHGPLDPALRAEHLAMIGATETAQAYLEAAEAAAGTMNHADAMRLAGTGRTCAKDSATELKLLMRQAHSAHEANRPQEAIALFDEVEAHPAHDPVIRIQAQIGKIITMRLIDWGAQAAETCDKAEKAARAANLSPELSEILYLRGSLRFPTGDFKGSLAAHAEALTLASELNSPRLMAAALSGRGDALYAQGRMRSARAAFDDCLLLCETHGLSRIKAANLFMRGTTRIYTLDWQGALDDAYASVELAQAMGHSRAEIVSRLTAGWVLAWSGAWNAAEQEVNRGLALVEATGARRFRPFLAETLGHVAHLRGDSARAVAILDEALGELRQLGIQQFIGPWVVGSLALALGAGDRQNALLAEGETLLATGAIGHNHYQFRRLAIEAAIARKDPATARHHAAALADFVSDEPTEYSQALHDMAHGDTAEWPSTDAARNHHARYS